MKRNWGAIMLVAGTCIGSGMIALPMVLAKLGLVLSIVLMLVIWFVMYYTSLVNLELNLQAGRGLSLGSLGRIYSGWGAKVIGTISLKLLSYALLAVFIYGGASILKELMAANWGVTRFSFDGIALTITLATFAMLLLPLRWIDYANRLLFFALLVIVGVLIVGLAWLAKGSNLPYWPEAKNSLSVWASVVPVVFTSFGFQVIFHTLTNYCHKDKNVLKQAFFWGSLIPAIIYIFWTGSVLSVVHQADPAFYQQMASGDVEVGKLVQVLSGISHWEGIQQCVWWISLLAIVTSIIGVGVGLCDSLREMMAELIPNHYLRKGVAALITLLPPFLVVIYVPNAFIAALGFAGMILAIIAVLLPIYLLSGINWKKLHYPELNSTSLLVFSTLVGLIVVGCELLNIF